MPKLSELMGYGRDVAQGASNAIAGNVSAPVDGLAWLLRKAGVPVPSNPMGGSDWMAQQGLTREPENRLAGLVGEFAGMAGPMVAAAKAPQIAKGMLQAGENLAAPATMNPQTGAIVWHGSPHKFDAFDSGKIGTGEGAQAYGHGLYLADSPEVAKGYQENLGKLATMRRPDGLEIGASLGDSNIGASIKHLESTGGDLKAAINTAPDRYIGNQLKQWEKLNWEMNPSDKSLYKVDLPDEHIAKMLDYDNPIAEAIRKPLSNAAMDQFGSGLTGTSGEKLYQEMIFNFKQAGHPNPTQAATDWLTQKGVPGMRYLDGGSRATSSGELIGVNQGAGGWQAKIRKTPSGQVGDIIPMANSFTTSKPFQTEQAARDWANSQIGGGTSNYVIFPGNENMLSILQRNGQAVK